MDNGKQLIILIVMMIIDSYQRLKDPYNNASFFIYIEGFKLAARNLSPFVMPPAPS